MTQRDRELTDHLYGGDTDYRLRQEAVLGIGGVRILEALNYDVNVYHMNEGHAALLTVGLMERQLGGDLSRVPLKSGIRRQCAAVVYLPPTPRYRPDMTAFTMEQTYRILGPEVANLLERMGGCHDGMLNMTYVAWLRRAL
jgi:starch phosphorylase